MPAAHVYTIVCSFLYIHSLALLAAFVPMGREASRSYFCIYSLLVLLFTLQQPFIKDSIFRVSIEAGARLRVGVITVAVNAAPIHLD